jgi:hypothetical protein
MIPPVTEGLSRDTRNRPPDQGEEYPVSSFLPFFRGRGRIAGFGRCDRIPVRAGSLGKPALFAGNFSIN